MKTDDKYTKLAAIMKAMGHPTRLLILDKLNEKEHCVCELQQFIDADLSTVSKHLSVLRNAGIIDSRKHNNMVIYRLIYPCVLKVYECMLDVSRNR